MYQLFNSLHLTLAECWVGGGGALYVRVMTTQDCQHASLSRRGGWEIELAWKSTNGEEACSWHEIILRCLQAMAIESYGSRQNLRVTRSIVESGV